MKYCSGPWGPVATMVVVNCLTGLMNVLIKKTLDGGIDHMIIASYRLAISTIFLAPIAYFWERKTRPKLTASILCQLFFSALVGASLTQYFFLFGLSHTSPTVSCAFLSMTPAITFILALAFRLEKVSIKRYSGRAKVIGTMVCISGALFLTFYKGVPVTPSNHWQAKMTANHGMNSSGNKKENWAIGIILLLIGATLWSSWLLVQARINKIYPCQYSSITILSCFGTIQSALLSLIKQRKVAAWILTGKFEIITVIYAGVVGQGVCTVAISWCIKRKEPVFTSAFTLLMLIFASIFDFSILHKQIYLGSVLGSVVVIIGLYIFLWAKSKDTRDFVIKQTQLAEANEDCSNTNSLVLPVTMNSTCKQ